MSAKSPSLDVSTTAPPSLVREIEGALVEMQQLARLCLGHEEFYRQLLERAGVTAAASWVSLWRHSGGTVALTQSFGSDPFCRRGGAGRYARVCQKLAWIASATPSSNVELPIWGDENGWAVVASIPIDDEPALLLVFAYDEPLPNEVAAGIARFATRVTEYAAKFEARRIANSPREAAAAWHRFACFTTAIHREGGLRNVAEEVVNEGSRYLECGRASVAVVRRGRLRIVAVSGVERFQRRAQGLRSLERLAKVVVRSGRPLYSSTPRSEIAPQLEGPLESHLDESGARDLAVLPLYEPRESDGDDRRPFGALLLESFDGRRFRDNDTALGRVVDHASIALDRALRLRSLPLLNRLLSAAHRRSRIAWSTAALWLLAASFLAAVGAALSLIQTELRIDAEGIVVPIGTQHVFAPSDGVVQQVAVLHGQRVEAGDVLVNLRSSELELQQERIAGETEITRRELAVLRAESLQQDGRNLEGARILRDNAARQELLLEKLDNLGSQEKIIQEQLAELTVIAPLAGEIVTWEADRELTGRPIRRGAKLLTIVDLDGPWQLRLETPDRAMGHVLKARAAAVEPLVIDFVLASYPEQTSQAALREIAVVSQATADGRGSSVLMEADFNPSSVFGTLRPNATVKASIHCGVSSLGYVWFHEVYEEFCRRFF